ncbi:hypothetical protein DYGSA30_32760 [Dyella sp. GSA-30]|nr:hypothetical protein DYGSA30_32760 [Dyella sp. GSA-30]
MQLLWRLFRDKAVAHHAGAMDDAVQAFELLRNAPHQLSECRRIADVDGVIAHDRPERFQFTDMRLNAFVQRRAAGKNQHRVPGLARYLARKDQSQATGAAGDQIDTLSLPR